MTYNFDPDRWYQIEVSAIRSRYAAGEMKWSEYEMALEELEKKLAKMWQRLDGTYRI